MVLSCCHSYYGLKGRDFQRLHFDRHTGVEEIMRGRDTKMFGPYYVIGDAFGFADHQVDELIALAARQRGRLEHVALRMYQHVNSDQYSLVIKDPDTPHRPKLGTLTFDSQRECQMMFNKCVKVFEFSKDMLVTPVSEDFGDEWGDEDEDAFDFDDSEDTLDFGDDEEDTFEW